MDYSSNKNSVIYSNQIADNQPFMINFDIPIVFKFNFPTKKRKQNTLQVHRNCISHTWVSSLSINKRMNNHLTSCFCLNKEKLLDSTYFNNPSGTSNSSHQTMPLSLAYGNTIYQQVVDEVYGEVHLNYQHYAF